MKVFRYVQIVTLLVFSFFASSCLSMPNLILVGKPGSGKGTVSYYLKNKHQYYQICLGDLFRKEIREKTEFGKKIASAVKNADYVDDKTTFNFVKLHIEKAKSLNMPIIFDGYPRSEPASKMLYEYLSDTGSLDNTLIIQLQAHNKVVSSRIMHRTVCNNCGQVFNDAYLKPKLKGSCDSCAYKLSKRPQDTQQIVAKRLKHYEIVQAPLYKNMKKQFASIKVDADLNKKDVLSRVESIVLHHDNHSGYQIKA